MDAPTVSVIIPVYNVERYLAQCLDSILGQTLQDIEVICVDDGSTDGSPAILEEYARQDGRMQVLYQRNQYAGVARNRGLAAAQGDYVIFLDSDDFFAPEMLEKTTQAARERNADIVIFGGARYDDRTQTVTKKDDFLRRALLPKEPVFSPADVPDTLFALDNPAPWCRLYARRFLLETRLQFQALPNANDFYFTLSSMALAERITAVDADFIYYRTNRVGSLQQDKHKDPLCFLSALESLYQELVQRGVFALLQTSFRHSSLSTILSNLRSVQTDEARLQILETLESEPYCQLPLQEVPGTDDGNLMVHRYSLQLSAARDWHRRSKKICALTEQGGGVQYDEAPEIGEVSVSVIIPVYNSAPYLDETLESIVNQTLKAIEIICINDGSTDESLEILERWAAKDKRIALFSQVNAGLSCTRNFGIAHARGEFIYFMDSDDILEQNALEQLVAVMEEKKLDALYFDGTTFYDNEELAEAFSSYQSTYTRSRAYDGVYDGATLLRKFSEEGKYAVSACLQILRTNFVRENTISFLPGIIYEDNPFTFEVLLKAKRTSHLQRAYFHRRIREGSIVTKQVTFFNVYSYYRCFRAMLQTYYETESSLTPENRSIALRRVAVILRNAQNDYAKMSAEYEGSELGLRENLFTFRTLVCNGGKREIKKLNEKIQSINSQKAELNQKLRTAWDEKRDRGVQIRRLTRKNNELQSKLKITYDEKYDRGVQVRELKKQQRELKKELSASKNQLSTLKQENAALKKKNKAMKQSTIWKVSRVVTWPGRKLKRLLKKLRKK
ncbi:MAG: glycosyltransferase [Clostridiales bacterium]|nr:glycosyltransferase [Clostridiales bacterium]